MCHKCHLELLLRTDQDVNDKRAAELYSSCHQKGTMYGMLLESVQHFIRSKYGDDAWARVLTRAGIPNMQFSTHRRYCDQLMTQLACACADLLPSSNGSREKCSADHFMNYFGNCFVDFFTHYGYDRIMRVAGRHYRDFLNGIDNLHETMRFSYPRMLSPSFYVSKEDSYGCILHYRSKRCGFTHYVIGQLQQCGLRFYDTKVEVFPFCIVFNTDLIITHVGDTLRRLFAAKPLIGCLVEDRFTLRRPQMTFSWENILRLQAVIFELESLEPIKTLNNQKSSRDRSPLTSAEATRTLLVKGQMRYLADLKSIAFLCTPLLSNLEEVSAMGLFINDLNMYDSSRDMVMAGWQHASRLEYSIEKQVAKSHLIADNLRQLDQWRMRSEELLYSMIPKQIAKRLKNGEDPVSTCEVFEQVTIMFGYLLGFNEMCATVSAMNLVQCINSVFMVFDSVVDRHEVFKVETLGDAAYMVAGGVPDRRADHAPCVAEVALEFVEKVTHIDVPMGHTDKLHIRIGMHTGSVVAGVVGKRMPQYCLFGDTVNTASRMQTYSQAGRIHVSEPCQLCLEGTDLVTLFRGRVNVKGKGQMNTYWLAGHRDDPQTQTICASLRQEQSKSLTLSFPRDGDVYDFRRYRKQSEICILELNKAGQTTPSSLGSRSSSSSPVPEPCPSSPPSDVATSSQTPKTSSNKYEMHKSKDVPAFSATSLGVKIKTVSKLSSVRENSFSSPRDFGVEQSNSFCRLRQSQAHNEMDAESLANGDNKTEFKQDSMRVEEKQGAGVHFSLDFSDESDDADSDSQGETDTNDLETSPTHKCPYASHRMLKCNESACICDHSTSKNIALRELCSSSASFCEHISSICVEDRSPDGPDCNCVCALNSRNKNDKFPATNIVMGERLQTEGEAGLTEKHRGFNEVLDVSSPASCCPVIHISNTLSSEQDRLGNKCVCDFHNDTKTNGESAEIFQFSDAPQMHQCQSNYVHRSEKEPVKPQSHSVFDDSPPGMRQYRSNSIAADNPLLNLNIAEEDNLVRSESAAANLESISYRACRLLSKVSSHVSMQSALSAQIPVLSDSGMSTAELNGHSDTLPPPLQDSESVTSSTMVSELVSLTSSPLVNKTVSVTSSLSSQPPSGTSSSLASQSCTEKPSHFSSIPVSMTSSSLPPKATSVKSCPHVSRLASVASLPTASQKSAVSSVFSEASSSRSSPILSKRCSSHALSKLGSASPSPTRHPQNAPCHSDSNNSHSNQSPGVADINLISFDSVSDLSSYPNHQCLKRQAFCERKTLLDMSIDNNPSPSPDDICFTRDLSA